jgi:hypothetical protein
MAPLRAPRSQPSYPDQAGPRNGYRPHPKHAQPVITLTQPTCSSATWRRESVSQPWRIALDR